MASHLIFSEEDKGRRNKIVDLLQEWGLLSVVNPESIKEPMASMNQIKIINHKEKGNKLNIKYNIGRTRKV